MTVKEIQKGLWYLGICEEGRRVFQNSAFTDSGINCGCYLMDAGEYWILLGSLPADFANEWIGEIDRFLDGRELRHAVLFGAEHDMTCVQALTARYPALYVIGGKTLLFSLEELGCRPVNTVEIRTKRRLKLGNRELCFSVLNDRFETASLYVTEKCSGALFTADAFGSFGAADQVQVSALADTGAWLRGAQQVYRDIRGDKRKKLMELAVRLVRDHDIKMICPAFGPVADAHMDELLAIYTQTPKPVSEKPVVAVIHTGSASMRILSEHVESGMASLEGGAALEVLDLDLSAMSRDEVLEALPQATAYLFGTDDCDDNASKSVWDIATSLRRQDVVGKRAAVFYTKFSGEHVPDSLRAYLTSMGMKLDMPDWFVEGKAKEKDLKNAVDYGFGIGCCVLGIPNPRQPKLVKCLVCGEIFDASLGTCPVCGVGLDQCQPVDEEEISYRRDTDRHYLIIGGCTAAISAADAIRQRDATGHIMLLSSETYLPINRPMLIKEIDVVVAEPETIQAHPAQWYEERKLDFRMGCTATAIHPENKTVETNSGEVFPYDKLILATGAECFIPPIQGSEKPGVIAVRHFEDTQELFRRMESCQNAVVIGGGILGLEAAREFMRSGIPVTVLEATPQIMWRQIDAESSALLRKAMKRMHIDCHEGVTVVEIEGDGKVTGVRLSDGRIFPADVVVLSCGVKANIQLAVAAGIKADRAIPVDMFMRTNVEDIYACGDCCTYDGVNYQLMAEASAQGRVAGAHAAGDESVYFANRLIGMHVEGIGATMFAIGDAGKNEKLKYKTVETMDEIRNRHEKYWFSGGALKGAVIINADEKMQDVIQKVETAARYEDIF